MSYSKTTDLPSKNNGMAWPCSEKRTFQCRLGKKWYHKATDSWNHTWILCCCGQEENEDGSLQSVMGCITDISLQKQAEEDAMERAKLSEKLARSEREANEIQVRSAIEAEDARKSMEKFMDITSHEMRNPLSAIIQSADGIATSLLEFQASSKSAVLSDELVESNLEAVNIISVSCPFLPYSLPFVFCLRSTCTMASSPTSTRFVGIDHSTV